MLGYEKSADVLSGFVRQTTYLEQSGEVAHDSTSGNKWGCCQGTVTYESTKISEEEFDGLQYREIWDFNKYNVFATDGNYMASGKEPLKNFNIRADFFRGLLTFYVNRENGWGHEEGDDPITNAPELLQNVKVIDYG